MINTVTRVDVPAPYGAIFLLNICICFDLVPSPPSSMCHDRKFIYFHKWIICANSFHSRLAANMVHAMFSLFKCKNVNFLFYFFFYLTIFILSVSLTASRDTFLSLCIRKMLQISCETFILRRNQFVDELYRCHI